uniref:Guanylate cyclase n=1 Tax=Magallana gigas TaxID=29159 RepID=K1QIT2_MAGGI
MFVQVYLLLSLNVVLAERERVRVGVFQADDTVPFGIHRSGPAVDLGVQKLKEFVGKDMDVEIINYLSLQGSECDPTRQGLFGKIAAEMHHLKNITAIIGPIYLVVCDNVALRWLLLTARSLGMTEGDHAFIYFFNFNGYINGNIMKKIGDEDEQAVKKAFESIFLIGLYQSQTKQYQEFYLQLKRRSLEQYNFSYFNEDLNPPTTAFYEAFALYGEVVNEAFQAGKDFKDGFGLSKRLWNRTFDGINGDLYINGNGDRESNWMLLDFDPYIEDFVLKSLSDISSTSMIMDKKVAIYKSSKIVLHKFNKKQPPSSKSFYVELVQMKNINCHNLTKFLGLTEHDSGLYSVTEFCSRGDLRDILSNEAFVLNREFSISLIRDIIQAMEYLHSSNIRFHGSLHSRSCVIDSRFVLKVTNFGLQSLKDFNIDFHSEKCLWVAPELLRKSKTSSDCIEMQCADIYSFGIIIYEVVSRKEPYENEKEFLTLEEIVMNLKTIGDEQFRPQLDTTEIDKNVIDLMRNCWDEDPTCRPSFQFMRKQSRKLHWDKSGDRLLDMLLSRMEEYANNLEDLVEERTQSLIIEKRKSDELLYQILPRSVADKLKTGCMVEPEAYACVTIYFSDIVGFTSLSSQSTPLQVIDFLNDLYICFDKTIENFDVYKVETIGDAYMVVSGLPTRNGDQHVVEIARMSCSILESAKKFKIKHIPDHRLSVRIGIHSGPVCAGVVGQKMPRYCLFGDTVNTASRMESNGEPMRIHTSENTRNLLNNHQDFLLEERGELQIKGKGIMRTYWLYLKADRNS